jgi:hypothetical protein
MMRCPALLLLVAAAAPVAERHESQAQAPDQPAAATSSPAPQPVVPTPLPTRDQVRQTVRRATDYLFKDQNADGSWGSFRNPGWGDEFWSNIETHRSWTVATTALVCLSMRDAEPADAALAAYERGLRYIVDNALVKRPSEWDTDNTWAYVYGLQALAVEYGRPRLKHEALRESIRKAAIDVMEQLKRYQTPNGGWGYYDNFADVTFPGSWATSFMTAVGVLALLDARDAGFDVDAKMLSTAIDAVRRCKLPNGAYTYSVDAVASPGHSEWINQVKGSLGRIQVCNLALKRAGDPITNEQLKTGLAHFFKEHRFLDVARQKPIPHEAYYLNSGYFYFFGHFYAAQIISLLPPEERAAAWPRLQAEIVKTQEGDGSMWDYYMNSYGRPYGTAYSLCILQQSLADEAGK